MCAFSVTSCGDATEDATVEAETATEEVVVEEVQEEAPVADSTSAE